MESVGLLQLHILQTELADPELRTLAIFLYSVYIFIGFPYSSKC